MAVTEGGTQTNINTQYSYQVEANDPEGLALTYYFNFAPSGMTIDDQGLVEWFPQAENAGENFAEIENMR